MPYADLEKRRAYHREYQRKWAATNHEKTLEWHKEQSRKRRAREPEKCRARVRKWRANNPDKRRAADRSWAAANPGKVRERSWRRQGIRLAWEEFLQMLAAQDHKCAICAGPLTPKSTHVDHCHRTGKVRGALCSRCNAGIGLLGDCPVRAANATLYLVRSLLCTQ